MCEIEKIKMKNGEFLKAVEKRDIEAVRILLSEGADINYKNDIGETAFHLAIEYDDVEMVKFLIENKANLELRDGNYNTPLGTCVQFRGRKSGEMMKLLIQAGSNVKQGCSYIRPFRNVLHEAVRINDSDLIKLLLDKGANVTEIDGSDCTPLHDAMSDYDGDTSIIETLLAANSDLNALDDTKCLPAHYLMVCDHDISKVLKILVKLEPNFKNYFNKKNKYGMTPLDFLMKRQIDRYVKQDMFEALIEIVGININAIYTPRDRQYRRGQTILHEAIRQVDLGLVKIFRKNGADINALDRNKATPLLYAMQKGEDTFQLYMIEYLLKHNADVNTISKKGYNILNYSINESGTEYEECVWKLVIEHLAKLGMIDYPLNADLLKTISKDDKYKDYFENCKKELKALKEHKLPESWISLLNILMDHKDKLVLYAENEEVVKDLKQLNINNFPIYGTKILYRFETATKKLIIYKQTANILSSCLPFNLPPSHLVIRKIVHFLNPKSYMKFVAR